MKSTAPVSSKQRVDKAIAEIRSFNRFYTSIIGLLDKHFLNSQFSLPEARILFEILNNRLCTSKTILLNLNIDRGYLSRILKEFEFKNIIIKKRSKKDARNIYLYLSPKGKKLYSRLSQTQNRQIFELINKINGKDLKSLTEHMNGIENILSRRI